MDYNEWLEEQATLDEPHKGKRNQDHSQKEITTLKLTNEKYTEDSEK